jgi:hypothetical protein
MLQLSAEEKSPRTLISSESAGVGRRCTLSPMSGFACKVEMLVNDIKGLEKNRLGGSGRPRQSKALHQPHQYSTIRDGKIESNAVSGSGDSPGPQHTASVSLTPAPKALWAPSEAKPAAVAYEFN